MRRVAGRLGARHQETSHDATVRMTGHRARQGTESRTTPRHSPCTPEEERGGTGRPVMRIACSAFLADPCHVSQRLRSSGATARGTQVESCFHEEDTRNRGPDDEGCVVQTEADGTESTGTSMLVWRRHPGQCPTASQAPLNQYTDRTGGAVGAGGGTGVCRGVQAGKFPQNFPGHSSE